MGEKENKAFHWGEPESNGFGRSDHEWFDRAKWLNRNKRKRTPWPKPEPRETQIKNWAWRIEKRLGMRFISFVERNPLTALSGVLTALTPFARVLLQKWGVTFTDEAWFAVLSFLAGFGLISIRGASKEAPK